MLQNYRLAIRKYMFDNSIDYIDKEALSEQKISDGKKNFTEERFVRALTVALAIAHFYKEHPDDDVMEKDTVTVLSRMATRSVYTAELEEVYPSKSISSSNIIAASMISEFHIPVRSGDQLKSILFVEPGGMRCTLGGFDIQKIMHAIRLLDRLHLDPTGYYVGATYKDAKVSPGNLLRMGFTERMDVPDELVEYRLYEIEEERHRGVRWFRPTIPLLVDFSIFLSNIRSRSIITRKMSGDRQYYRPEIQSLEVIFDRGFDSRLFSLIEDVSKKKPDNHSDLCSACNSQVDLEFFV